MSLIDFNGMEIKESSILINKEDGEMFFVSEKVFLCLSEDMLKSNSLVDEKSNKCLIIEETGSIYTVIREFDGNVLYTKELSEDSWKEVEDFYPNVVEVINKYFYTNFKSNIK